MKKIKIHHIGFVVKDIDFFEKNLIYTEILDKVYDPIQKANLALYQVDQKDSSMIELIQPMDEKSLTFNFLKIIEIIFITFVIRLILLNL